jgi:hypothetical protein
MATGSTDDPRKERVIKNEIAFRAYNERRTAFEGDVADEAIPIVCECGDETCFAVIDIVPDEWDEAHVRDDTFVIAPDHVYPDLERVVGREETYWIVQKLEPPSEVQS